MMNKYTTIAVDLSSLAYRSFYGLPDSIKSTEGKPVNAIKGYLDALNRFIKMYKPKEIIHAMDEDWRPQWRVNLLPQYKAHRVEESDEELVPDDLEYQLAILPQILQDMGMKVVGAPKAEADDLLAVICHERNNVVVITGDRDLLQLINDKKSNAVHMLGKDGGTLFTEKEVLYKYGVKSNQYVDFSVLRGDASDGLPGVKGIGEKTAAKLIYEFDNVENLISEATKGNASISKRISASILDSTDYIKNAIKVVTLKNDLDIDLSRRTHGIGISEQRAKYLNLKIGNQLDTFNESSKSRS
jgi:5'-3' exonuclease